MSARSDIMPDRQEIISSLYGAFRLALFDENGIGYFNISVEGFWRSFFAAVILAPFYMLSIGQDFMTPQGGFSFWAALVHFLTYGASWILFPLVAFFATDLLNLGHRFTALVVAVNWSSVLIFGLLAIGVGVVTLVQQALADLALVILTAGLIVYHWFVIKTALETTAAVAIAFVLFNFLLGAMLHQIADRLI
ncbi:MAG: hypothetical protein HC871_07075 [Rhizobiales bacterium]|nr:hypothetical protein [Hyphomicrobiales bacterium]